MEAFTVEPEVLRQKAHSLDALAADYDSMRKRLLNTATSMGDAYKSGDSRTYVAKITEFCDRMQEVSDQLRSTAQMMTTQANNYDNTESEGVARANRLA